MSQDESIALSEPAQPKTAPVSLYIRATGRSAQIAFLAIICVVHFFVVTQNNEFHFQQHPDEISKVEQILKNKRNFNHPLLMLNAVKIASKIRAAVAPKKFKDAKTSIQRRFSPQDIAEMGRTFSAIYTTLGIFCLGLAFIISGYPLAGILGAAFAAMNYSVVLAAHYFKEDATLLFGIGLYLLATTAYFKNPTRLRAILMAAASAVLLSSKWAGGIFIITHWIAVLSWGDRKSAIRWIWWQLGTFIGVFALINCQIFENGDLLTNSFSHEVEKLTRGRQSVEKVVGGYNTWPFGWLTKLDPGKWMFYGGIAGVVLAFFGKLGKPMRTLALLPVLYTLSLGLIDKISARYILPATFFSLIFAGAFIGGAIHLAFHFKSRWPKIAVSLAALFLAFLGISGEFKGSKSLYTDLKISNHEAAWTWIRENLDGKDAKIVQIRRHLLPGKTGLYDPETPPLPVEFTDISDRGLTYQALLDSGTTHLVFRSSERNNAKRGIVDPTLFDDLDEKGDQKFIVPTGPIGIIQPGMEIYEIR